MHVLDEAPELPLVFQNRPVTERDDLQWHSQSTESTVFWVPLLHVDCLYLYDFNVQFYIDLQLFSSFSSNNVQFIDKILI